MDLHIATSAQKPIFIENVPQELNIKLDAGVHATVISTLTGSNISQGIEITLGESAVLNFICLEMAESGADVSISQRSKIGANAKLHCQNITLGGGSVTHDLESELIGASALSDIDWIFYAKGRERQQLSARNIFNAADGGGEITMRGVAEEKAHTVCNGTIEIGERGNGTDTYLTEDVLMLDKTAKVDAIPGLEIKTNDVKASHSATVSKVTADDLFYFASRGLPEKDARQMYVVGFLGDVMQKFLSSQVQKEVVVALEEKYRL